nr:hypothetical protein [Tanacetum cinerariifolium]
MMVQNQSQLGKGSTILTDPHHTPTIIQPLTQPQKKQQPRNPKRKDTEVPQPSDPIENVPDEAVHKELGDSLVKVTTIAFSLEAKQDNGNINKTQSKVTPNESSSQGTNSGNTLQSDEDSLKLDKLVALCTTLQNMVLVLEKTTTTQHNEMASLKMRIKKLEKKNRSRTHKMKRLYKGKIGAIDADEKITMVSVQDEVVSNDADKEMFDMDVLDVEVINTNKLIIDAAQVSAASDKVSAASAATTISAATTTTAIIITVDDITLAQALKEIKTAFDEEERLVRKKAKKVKEANFALIETWDDIQAKIDADHRLAERMQAQEQEEFSIAEKATLFQALLEKRRKHFTAKRIEEKINKPPTKAQQRKLIHTYLKNMKDTSLKI